MRSKFVNYEIAKVMTESGFNEFCLAYYDDKKEIHYKIRHPKSTELGVAAPLRQQVFNFFRNEYQWQSHIEATSEKQGHKLGYNYFIWNSNTGQETNSIPNPADRRGNFEYDTYEDAEVACLIKLVKLNAAYNANQCW